MTLDKGVSGVTVTLDKKLSPCFYYFIHRHWPAVRVDRRPGLGLDDVDLQVFDHHDLGVRELPGHQHVLQIRHRAADGVGQAIPSCLAGFVGDRVEGGSGPPRFAKPCG